MTLQTVLFDKDYWNKQTAVLWLMNHGYSFTDIDVTSKFLRFRQQTPRHGRYYTKTLPNHIELVYQE